MYALADIHNLVAVCQPIARLEHGSIHCMPRTSVYKLLLFKIPNANSHVNCVLITQSANLDVVQVMVVVFFAENLVKMNLESLSMKSLN